MDCLFKEMEIFAEENHVPIIKEAERAIFRGIMAKYQPKHILEIGTAIGYSALLMAHCGQGAKIKTLELSEERARTAQSFIDRSPYKDDIEIVVGDAGETLLSLAATEMFDMVFIDAAKGQYPDYLQKILPHLNAGGVIVTDNVLFRGYVLGTGKPPRRYKTIVKRLREYLQIINDEKIFKTMIYEDGDGLAVSQKINDN
ncbi:O-methyltransferase [Megamonas hypermegale]|uniref:O-methyltransferase n=1 Tax=Megamonas hypermegale TaxID=158847 RepID=UPI0025A3BC4C|nr:O-methyltransferase [Megamonas hypermegale]MDM8142159.1 O-methyltransferase [Megamonas hypermegale]